MTFNTPAGAAIERKLMILYLNTGTGESPVWSSVGCEPQPMLGMFSKCWPEHQTFCNLLRQNAPVCDDPSV